MEMAERRRTRCGQLVRTNGLVLLTLAGVVLGLSSGFGIRELKPTATAIMWIGMIGELYLRVLEMMIVPLIITSIISVTSTMDPKSNGRISAVCLVYTLVCNFVPSVIGCLLCIAVGPGNAVKEKFTTEKHQSNHGTTMDTSDVLADLLRNFFPDNIVEATFLQTQTTYNLEKTSQLEMMLNETSLKDTRLRHMKTVRSPNILGLVMICTLFGIASGVLRDVSKPFQAFFSSASDVIMQVLRWIMWLTPIGVASLITKIICSADNIADDFQKLGMFIVTAAGGMVFCGLVIPVSFFILRRTNPFPFVLSLSQPIMMTFATANTPITMPAVMTILENEHGVDRRVCRFVMPFVMTLCRSGSAFYIALSALFVYQMFGSTSNVATVMLICLLTTITSTGAAPIPSSSLMAVIIIIAALNIPAESVTLLYTFDWLLDRIRSVVNLLFQAFAVLLTQDICGKSLASPPSDSTENELNKTIPISDQSIEIRVEDITLQETTNCISDIANV